MNGITIILIDEEKKKNLSSFKLVNNILNKIQGPLEEAILTPPGYEIAKELSTSLTELHNNLEAAITHAGIYLGFNSRDGD
jgi:predicted lipoprotein